MKQALHFGAGNIGRGFIGEILAENGFAVTFVDVNDKIIDALNHHQGYEIEIAEASRRRLLIEQVSGINNRLQAEAVIDAVAEADIITTAIGPHILPLIAELIARGIQKRRALNKEQLIDILACENMIGASQFLKQEVLAYLEPEDVTYLDTYIGFPNTAVDRIVPAQSHEDPLFVVVEPFKEWVVETKRLKNPAIVLEGVHYEEDLEPFIERKLFSVNSGHATAAYTGAHYGAKTILEALQQEPVRKQLEGVLTEIRRLLVNKWGFEEAALEDYHRVIIQRFDNPHIIDDIERVARTPIRKLGYDERFIRPIRELKEAGLPYDHLLQTLAYLFTYQDPSDEQSVQLQNKLRTQALDQVVHEVTSLEDETLIMEIVNCVQPYIK